MLNYSTIDSDLTDIYINENLQDYNFNKIRVDCVFSSTKLQCDPPSATVPRAESFISVCAAGGTDTTLCCKACSLFAVK